MVKYVCKMGCDLGLKGVCSIAEIKSADVSALIR